MLDVIKRPAIAPGVAAFKFMGEKAPPAGKNDDDAAKGISWERWELQTEPGDRGRVPMLLAKPTGQAEVKKPAVMVLHGTGGHKEQVATHLRRYASLGYVACSFDSRYSGERTPEEDAPQRVKVYNEALIRCWHENFKGDEKEAPKEGDEHPFIFDAVWDMTKVIDLLVSRQDVDAKRIGATGISLGGMQTWFGAVADPRITAAAPSIGVQGFKYALQKGASWKPDDGEQLTKDVVPVPKQKGVQINDDSGAPLFKSRIDSIRPVFQAAMEEMKGVKGPITGDVVETVWRRICPGLLEELDSPSSLRCIAPRPLLIMNGERDWRCPIQGVRQAFECAEAEYKKLGAPPGTAQLYVADGVGHEVTKPMWDAIDAFFEKHLCPQKAKM